MDGGVQAMRKWFTFDTGEGTWVGPERFAPIFLDAKRRDFFSEGKEGGFFSVDGLEGTEDLQPATGRVDALLYVMMHPKYGVVLYYRHWNGKTRIKISLCSKGDLRLLGQYVRTVYYETPLDRGLFVSFEQAWSAVEEFMENDGSLPRSVEWVSESEIPQIPDTMYFAGG